ncbi:MAG TPA: FecR family protein [Flavitalea sp.]|nr:FecR family protein [Flavitalea sp.]
MRLYDTLDYLLRGHINGSLSDKEKLQLLEFLDDRENLEKCRELIIKLYADANDASGYQEEEVEKLIHFILESDHSASSVQPSIGVRRFTGNWIKYAAAVIILFCAGLYLWPKKQAKIVETVQRKQAPVAHDALPGSNKALLTLSNGKIIELNQAKPEIITDGKLAIRNENGVLTYRQSDVVAYNTTSTPNGAQYRLTLPDGTNVWLNSTSSITYPLSFPGQNRIVTITGEAYFEVFKNPKQPFFVRTFKDEILVTGTHFNINAYDDEAGIKTSLAEGSVRIDNKTLKPGEAFMNGQILTTNLEQDLAWKNGVFDFNRRDLQAVMRQISRWYDVDVIYEKNIPSMQFYGKMGRDLNLSQVLSILEKSGVNAHFKIDEKKLIVNP